MIDRRFVLQSLSAAIAAACLPRSAGATSPPHPSAVLLDELARIEARSYSEEGIPMFLACENRTDGSFSPPAGYEPSVFNQRLAETYREYARLLPGLEREMTEYDAANLVELLALRDFEAGGA